MNYLTLIIVAIISFALGRQSKKSFMPKQAEKPYFAEATKDELDDMRKEAHEALSERTEKRKERILEFMNSEAVHQKELKACDLEAPTSPRLRRANKQGIVCSDIEKLLEVSGATARKYLNELEGENKIK